MKRLLVFLSLIAAVLQVGGGVLDARSRAVLGQRVSRSAGGPEYTGVIAMLDGAGGDGMAALDEAGAIIWGRRGDMVLCCVPTSSLDIIDRADGLVTASVAGSVCATMDVARAVSHVDAVHRGEGLAGAFDGTGVVAGLCDTGLDPGHEAFSGGRIRQLGTYDTSAALREIIEDPGERYPADASHYHATHVASIMAGGRVSGVPYYGVATGADIVAGMTDLTDVAILASWDDIIAYAREAGRPAVINTSLAGLLGPRDGSSLFNRYAAMQAEEAVMVLSAGNYGQQKYGLRRVLSDGGVTTALTTWTGMDLDGYAEVWGGDESALGYRIGVWDRDGGAYVAQTGLLHGDVWLDSADPSGPLKEFCRLFDGMMTVTSEVSRLNGRSHIVIRAACNTTACSSEGQWARFALTVTVEGRPGNCVDMYTDGSMWFGSLGVEGFCEGDAEMSISDLACSPGVVAVGMIRDRARYPLADGGWWDDQWEEGVISPHSSYGTLPDGRRLPHISAPGSNVVAALNSAYESAQELPVRVAARHTGTDGRTHSYFAAGGTSMSSPVVAGVAACMLQADPSLTPGEVREILQSTSRYDMPDAGDPRYGSGGVLDAVGAMRAVAGNGSLPVVGAMGMADGVMYDIHGRRVSNPVAGIYIVARPDGSRRKVAFVSEK